MTVWLSAELVEELALEAGSLDAVVLSLNDDEGVESTLVELISELETVVSVTDAMSREEVELVDVVESEATIGLSVSNEDVEASTSDVNGVVVSDAETVVELKVDHVQDVAFENVVEEAELEGSRMLVHGSLLLLLGSTEVLDSIDTLVSVVQVEPDSIDDGINVDVGQLAGGVQIVLAPPGRQVFASTPYPQRLTAVKAAANVFRVNMLMEPMRCLHSHSHTTNDSGERPLRISGASSPLNRT